MVSTRGRLWCRDRSIRLRRSARRDDLRLKTLLPRPSFGLGLGLGLELIAYPRSSLYLNQLLYLLVLLTFPSFLASCVLDLSLAQLAFFSRTNLHPSLFTCAFGFGPITNSTHELSFLLSLPLGSQREESHKSVRDENEKTRERNE